MPLGWVALIEPQSCGTISYLVVGEPQAMARRDQHNPVEHVLSAPRLSVLQEEFPWPWRSRRTSSIKSASRRRIGAQIVAVPRTNRHPAPTQFLKEERLPRTDRSSVGVDLIVPAEFCGDKKPTICPDRNTTSGLRLELEALPRSCTGAVGDEVATASAFGRDEG